MAIGVYGRFCVPRSIDSASIPQQPCDPSVMLLIVTPEGSRASARARQSRDGGRDGQAEWRRADGKRQRGRVGRANRRVGAGGERRGGSWNKRRKAGAKMEKQRRMGLWSLWDCGQGRPSCFLCPLVSLCPPMSLYVQSCPWTQSHSHSQITSVAHIPE